MPRRATLQQRWFILASALGVGTALIGVAFYLLSEFQHRHQDLQNFAAILTRTFAANFPDVIRADQSDLVRVLSVAGLDPLIENACLFDAHQTLLASWARPDTSLRDCDTSNAAGTLAYLRPSAEVYGDDHRLRVELVVNRRSLIGVMLQLALPTVIFLILVLVAVMVLARLLARSALLPITRLTDSAVNFNPQAPALQVLSDTPQEVSKLTEAFNRVIDTLLEAQKTLQSEIIQRNAAQNAERSARDLLRNIVDLVPYVIFARREDGTLVFANQAVANLYGTTLEHLLDNTFFADYAGLKPDGLLFPDNQRTTHAEETWFTDSRGDVRRFLVSQVPYEEADSKLVIAVDVTEEYRLQMQLQFSQRLEVIGTLAGGIAHDFNNLLTPILGYTSMLMETSLPADVHDKLRAMENAASRARDVVQQILTFSRQQQAIPVRTPIDISQVITEAVSLMQASIPSSVRIVKELEETGAVVVDPNQLHQVVVNLCTNAAQAIDAASGLITVRLYQIEPGSPLIPAHIAPAAFACIEVTDSGRGMSREVIGHIFEPFFTTKKVGEGSGLGLSVVHGIVTTYGGEITVESEERRGTTFRVLLPLALQPVDAAVRGVRVLLVDDEQAVLRVTGELLTTQGFEVESFTNPRMALEAFSRAPAEFDVLLTDHNMPEMTGSELARQIRAVRPDLPIILITGFASSSEDELGGIDHKIMKPVSGRELSMVIQQSLALRHHPG